MFKHVKGDELVVGAAFVYLPRGFIFWNPEPGDFSLILLLRCVHTSHQSVKVHAHQLRACSHLLQRSHSPELDWFLNVIPGGFLGVIKTLL